MLYVCVDGLCMYVCTTTTGGMLLSAVCMYHGLCMYDGLCMYVCMCMLFVFMYYECTSWSGQEALIHFFFIFFYQYLPDFFVLLFFNSLQQ